MMVMLSLGALCAALALLTAHLHLATLANALAVGAALCGLMAFASAAGFTLRRARRFPERSDRR
jgi:membrane protein implicated in regulation of membrane protease activity